MTQTFEKQAAFTKKATDLPDVPSPTLTPAEIKEYFQTSSDELLESFNKVVDGLNQPKVWTEDKLADGAISRRTIQPGAVGLKELDPAIANEPTTPVGVQTKLAQHDEQLADIGINGKVKGTKGDGVTDDTLAIQNALNDLSTTGGVLYLPKGTYLCGQITIPRHVRVVGAGQYQTILKLKNGAHADFIVFNGARGSGIENVSIDGNKTNNTSGSGILIKNDRSDIPWEDAVNGLQIQSVHITNCKEHGIKAIAPKVWVFTIRFAQIDHCDGYGVYNTATDNTFIGLNIAYCSAGGIYENGGNNRWIGAKIYINGQNAKDTGGLYIENCNRSQFSNIESQENYGHGVSIKNGKNLILENIICDLNGYDYRLVDTTGLDNSVPYAYGFYILYSNSIKISGMADNWKATSTPSQSTQKAPYYIDSACDDIVLNIQTRNHLEAGAFLNENTVLLHNKVNYKFKSVTFQNSFTGYIEYRKDASENVMFQGVCDKASPVNDEVLFTLPTSARPKGTKYFPIFTTDGSNISKGMARLYIEASGNVKMTNIPTGATKFFMGGVYFSTV